MKKVTSRAHYRKKVVTTLRSISCGPFGSDEKTRRVQTINEIAEVESAKRWRDVSIYCMTKTIYLIYGSILPHMPSEPRRLHPLTVRGFQAPRLRRLHLIQAQDLMEKRRGTQRTTRHTAYHVAMGPLAMYAQIDSNCID